MKINWDQDKLTIIGFAIIFVILGIFGYLLWTMNQDPMSEVSVTESTPSPVETESSEVEVVKKEELPDYPITKVDTTGWRNQEFALNNVGIRYKSPDFDTSLSSYGLPEKYSLFQWDGVDKLDLKSNYGFLIDYLISISPFGLNTGAGAYWAHPIEISIIESKDLSLENIFNVFANEQCEYEIVEREFDDYGSLYDAVSKCKTKEIIIGSVLKTQSDGTFIRKRENKRLDEVTSLCVSGQEIEQFNNPFIFQDGMNKVSNLIKCNSILGVDNDRKLQIRDRVLFVLALEDNQFAIINYQDTGIPGANSIEKENSQKINNIMHTILSTIEVI